MRWWRWGRLQRRSNPVGSQFQAFGFAAAGLGIAEPYRCAFWFAEANAVGQPDVAAVELADCVRAAHLDADRGSHAYADTGTDADAYAGSDADPDPAADANRGADSDAQRRPGRQRQD